MAITRETKNKFALFLLATALVSLALYFVVPPLRNYLLVRMSPGTSPDKVAYIPELILWSLLAYVLVRALNATIFEFAFRIRKGYEATIQPGGDLRASFSMTPQFASCD